MSASMRYLAYANGVALVSIAVCIACVFHIPLYIDAATIFHFAQRIVQGDRLYEDVITTQTPFLIYYYAIPAWVAQHFALSPVSTFLIFCAGIITFSTFLCLYIIHQSPVYRQPKYLFTFAITLPLLMCIWCCFYVANNLTAGDLGVGFGQREHIFFVLFLPFIFLTLNSLHGITINRGVRIIVGVSGLLGCLVKPHFVLLYFMNELYLAIHFRKPLYAFRIESLIIGIGTIVAHAGIFVLFPHYIDQLFMFKAMYVIQQVAFNRFIQDVLLYYLPAHVLTICLWLGLRLIKPSPIIPESNYLLSMVLGGLLVYGVQQAGYIYHGIPMLGCMLLLAIFVLLHVEHIKHHADYFMTACMAGLLILSANTFFIKIFDPDIQRAHAVYQYDLRVLKDLVYGKTFVTLSTDLWPGYSTSTYTGWRDVSHSLPWQSVAYFYYDQIQAANLHYDEQTSRKLCTTFCTTSCPEGIDYLKAQYHSPQTMTPEEKRYFELLVSDVVDRKPDLLLVRPAKTMWLFGMLDFNFIPYLNQDPRFKEEFQHYHEVESQPLLDSFILHTFKIYQRDPERLTHQSSI